MSVKTSASESQYFNIQDSYSLAVQFIHSGAIIQVKYIVYGAKL